MQVKNRGKNTINISLEKSHEGFGNVLILTRGQVETIPFEMSKEKEINKYIEKGIICEVVAKKKETSKREPLIVSNEDKGDRKEKKNKKIEEVS
jgi:hypothetical protein